MAEPVPYRDQGLAALQAGNLDQAADLLARAVASDERDASALALLGVVFSRKGLHRQACRALQMAVTLEPQHPIIRFNLAVAQEYAGNRTGAITAYLDTVKLQPDHPRARARLAALGVALGDVNRTPEPLTPSPFEVSAAPTPFPSSNPRANPPGTAAVPTPTGRESLDPMFAAAVSNPEPPVGDWELRLSPPDNAPPSTTPAPGNAAPSAVAGGGQSPAAASAPAPWRGVPVAAEAPPPPAPRARAGGAPAFPGAPSPWETGFAPSTSPSSEAVAGRDGTRAWEPAPPAPPAPPPLPAQAAPPWMAGSVSSAPLSGPAPYGPAAPPAPTGAPRMPPTTPAPWTTQGGPVASETPGGNPAAAAGRDTRRPPNAPMGLANSSVVSPPPVPARTGGTPTPQASPKYPPALVQCVQCRLWTRALPCCEQCGASLAPAPTGAGAPIPAVAAHASTPYEPPPSGSPSSPMIGPPALAVHDFAAHPGGETDQDAFNPLQGFADLARVLWAPRKFFAAQAVADGLKAPMAFLLSAAILVTLALLLFYGTAGLLGTAGMGLVARLVCGAMGGWISLSAIGIVSAGLVHGFARLFQGIGHFAGTFRVMVYSWAPYVAAMVLLAPLLGTQSRPTPAAVTPEPAAVRVSELLRRRASRQGLARPPSPSPVPGFEPQAEMARRVSQAATAPVLQFINVVLSLWCTALLCCGLARVHQIHAGVGFLAVLAACLVPLLLVGVLAVLLPLVVAMRK